MKCNKTENMLLDYFYNELDENDCREFEKHLETCADCSGELEEMRLTSKAMGTWEVPEQKINMVFVSEKLSIIDRIKEMLPSFDLLRKRPAMSFMYGLAGVFLMLSVANFEVSYDSDSGSFNMATSMFGKKAEKEDASEYELANRQLMETQSQMIELVNQMMSERETRQQEYTYDLVSDVVRELENRRENDLKEFGLNLVRISEMTDQNNRYINANRSMLVDLASTAGVEIKR